MATNKPQKMPFKQNINIEQYLQPSIFDPEFVDARMRIHWLHWQKCFDDFADTIKEQLSISTFPSEAQWNTYKLRLFINRLSPKVFRQIMYCNNYANIIIEINKLSMQPAPIAPTPRLNPVTHMIAQDKKSLASSPQDDSLADISKLTEKLFEDAKLGKLETINKIKSLKDDNIKAIVESRNRRHKTVLQEAIINRREQFAAELLITISKVTVNKFSAHESTKAELITEAENFIYNSIPKLVDFRSNPQTNNRAAISVILYAYNFVTEYKNLFSGIIIDPNVKVMDSLLQALEFDERCAKFTTYDQGRGLLYFELTNSQKESDVIFFIDLFECNAIAPAKRFLESLKNH